MSLPVVETGPADAEAVVLLHGWPGGPHTWRRLAPMLASRFRVLVPELRDVDLGAQADAVRALLRDRGIERYAAVGHGHGGGVAQLLGVGPAPPEALVLVDTIAFDRALPTDRAPRALIEQGSVEFPGLDAQDLEAYLAWDGPRPSPIDLSRHVPAMATWTFPVLLLWGEEDRFVPADIAERLSDALPASTLGFVPDSGHFLLDDAFDPVGVMIHEYLRARYQGAPHGHEGVVRLQLERRPPWVDLAPYEVEDEEPAPVTEQEIGPNA